MAAGLLKRMEDVGCDPDVVTHNAIIDSFCKDRLVTETLDLFVEMTGKRISRHLQLLNSGSLQFRPMEAGFNFAE